MTQGHQPLAHATWFRSLQPTIFQTQELIAALISICSEMPIRGKTLLPPSNATICCYFIIQAYAGIPFPAVLAFERT